MAQDVLSAVIDLLKNDGPVAALVSTRVYGEEEASSNTPDMPRPLIVVRHGPGVGGMGGFLEVEELTFEVYSYAETPYRADVLRRAVHAALKYATRQVRLSVLLHYFNQFGAPQIGRHPETQWPYALSTWRCLASETQVT